MYKNLSEIVPNKDVIITKAMLHPALTKKRKPTFEQAMKAVQSEIENVAIKFMADEIEEGLEDTWDWYTLHNGEREETEPGQPRDDYESGIDDQIETLFGPYIELLSQDWLANNCIDTHLWEENAVLKLSQSFGKEVYKQLTYGKTPAKILSSAGIVQEDVEQYFNEHIETSTPEKEKQMSEETLEDIVKKVATHLGSDFDKLEVYDDIETMCDDDEILANGAAARLGLEESDVEIVQGAVIQFGEDTAEKILDMISEAAKPVKATRNRRKKEEQDPSEPPKLTKGGQMIDSLDAEIIRTLKECSGIKDVDMAAEIGVSRSTFSNWAAGKAPCSPDGAQYEIIRDRLVETANRVLIALASLDGTDPISVE